MDKRINYKIVLDTETCPLEQTDEVTPWNMFVYDIGWAIVDKRGKVYKTQSFINADIFLDEKELMKSAYYSEKIPKYWKDIKSGTRQLKSFYNIRKQLLEDIAEYGVKEIYAHNMRFDYDTLQNTQRWLTKSKYRYFFPKGIEICDTLKMARQVLKDSKMYRVWCEQNDYITKNNQCRFSAEVLYRYITGNDDFIESHTGLEDVMIEKDILAYCYSRHKKMVRQLWA